MHTFEQHHLSETKSTWRVYFYPPGYNRKQLAEFGRQQDAIAFVNYLNGGEGLALSPKGFQEAGL